MFNYMCKVTQTFAICVTFDTNIQEKCKEETINEWNVSRPNFILFYFSSPSKPLIAYTYMYVLYVLGFANMFHERMKLNKGAKLLFKVKWLISVQ